ncbi:MAG: hypothetical protein A2Y14_04425 [Verrucomicrobia bacterium GWF2_51_19]|nr:MAG: hypothetical protein A2Y14_04425 [Verrucomicrobia bacterium GWF2_51_19]
MNLFNIGVNCCRYVFGTIYDCEVIGELNIPKDGACLVASNHVSFFDPPLAGIWIQRPIHFFARKTLFYNNKGHILEGLNTIPVDRDGDSDVGAFRKVLALLKAGEVVGIFPEGTRSTNGVIQSAKRGVGMMACRAAVPVVPARVFGTFEAWGKGKPLRFDVPLRVIYDRPIYPQDFDPGENDPNRYQVAADRILQAIAKIAYKS